MYLCRMKRTWFFVLLLLPFWLNAQEQLDNMNFDQWSRVKGTWYPSSKNGRKHMEHLKPRDQHPPDQFHHPGI